MSDYSGDSQRTEMIERERSATERKKQAYVESLEREIQDLKRKLKKYEEGENNG